MTLKLLKDNDCQTYMVISFFGEQFAVQSEVSSLYIVSEGSPFSHGC